MNRIVPREIAAAYAAHKSMQKQWGLRFNSEGVLIAILLFRELKELKLTDVDMAERLGVSREYLEEFIKGFNSRAFDSDSQKGKNPGWDDGVLAWEVVDQLDE